MSLMKSNKFLILILALLLFDVANSQHQTVNLINGKDIAKNRRTLKKYLKLSNTNYIDKNNKIRLLFSDCIDTTNIYNCKIQDSIIGLFKIIKIIEKKDNYELVNNKLKKRTIYFIDIKCSNNTRCPKSIRLISVSPEKMNDTPNIRQIQEDEIYHMNIYSFFENDFTYYINEKGDTTHYVFNPLVFKNFLFENIFVKYANITSYNLFANTKPKRFILYSTRYIAILATKTK